MEIVKHDNPTHEVNLKDIGHDPYAILGVPRDAPNDMIKRAYRALAAIYHSDVFCGDPNTFIAIGRAKDCLLDPKKRALYDEFYIFGDHTRKPVKRAAIAKVQMMMNQTIAKAPDLAHTDIKASMLQGIKQGIIQIDNDIKRVKEKIRKHEKIMTRISSTGQQGEVLIELLKLDLKIAIKQHQAEIANLKAEILIFDEVIILLKEFECTYEKKSELTGATTGVTNW